MKLNKLVCIVTGGSSGLGEACVYKLLNLNNNNIVIVFDIILNPITFLQSS